MKKKFAIFLAALMVLPAARVYATEYDEGAPGMDSAAVYDEDAGDLTKSDLEYSGRLDTETMMPSEVNESVAVDTDTRVRVTDDISYNMHTGQYVYSINGGKNFVYSNVADGMISDEPVIISADEGVSLVVYLDGEELTDVDLTHIFIVGDFSVQARIGDYDEGVFSFSVIGDEVSRYSVFNVPNGFVLESAKRDDEAIMTGTSSVDLRDEGVYDIRYTCTPIAKTYELRFSVDRTPPQVTLIGVKDDGKARGPVTVEGLTETDRMEVYHEGTLTATEGNIIKDPGSYMVTVTDGAGNSADYIFRIMVYLDGNSIIFIVVLVAVIAALIGYLVIRRKRFRIR